MEDKNEYGSGDIKLKSPVIEKLENFWYHYKIHTLAAVFVVIVLTVLCIQTCSRVSYDGYIVYAGPHEIKQNAGGPYVNALSSFKRVCDDYDGNGSTNVAFLNLFVVNSEEAESLIDVDGLEINYNLVSEDTETLHQTLLYGDYYVCFLSERLFREYETQYTGIFAPVEKYLTDGREYEFAGENGVFLRSLAFYSLPEISNMPEDTVVCIRNLSDVSTLFGKSRNQKSFQRGEKIITNIFAYE